MKTFIGSWNPYVQALHHGIEYLNHFAPGYLSSLMSPSSIFYFFNRCSIVTFHYGRTHKKIMVYISILCLFAWNILLSLALLVNYFSFYKIRCRGQFPQEALPDSTNYFPSDSWYLEWNSIDAFIISYLNLTVHLRESPTRFLWALIFWFYSPVPWYAVQGSWIEKCSVVLLQFFKNPFYF